jgi:hypothetical protein
MARPSPYPSEQRAREVGVWLARNGNDRRPVMVGLALLRGTAKRQDISLVKTVGLLKCFDSAAVKVLASIPGAAPELIWLAERSRPHSRSSAVEELCKLADPATLPWLLRHAMDERRGISSTLARQIAEGTSLAGSLSEDHCDEQVWDQAGRILLAMTSTRNYETEIGRYEDARPAYRRFAASAARMTPTLDHCAALVSITDDLRTGPAACLPWAGSERESVIAELLAVLRSPGWSQTLSLAAGSTDPTTRWRARWAKQAAQRGDVDDPASAEAGNRFEIRVVMPDPDPEGFPQVETRILIGGRPIIAAAFDKGPAGIPERLLGEKGGLRADVEPREVRLAEAYCTEGCCGGLYVTIVRDGDEVVWRDWRSGRPIRRPWLKWSVVAGTTPTGSDSPGPKKPAGSSPPPSPRRAGPDPLRPGEQVDVPNVVTGCVRPAPTDRKYRPCSPTDRVEQAPVEQPTKARPEPSRTNRRPRLLPYGGDCHERSDLGSEPFCRRLLRYSGGMDVDVFLELIEQARLQGEDPDVRLQWLNTQLVQRPVTEIVDFQIRLEETKKWADTWLMWGAAYLICDGLCSDDGFWYFQPWLVGLGRDAYERVAAHPDGLAEVPEVQRLVWRDTAEWAEHEWPQWESLNYLASTAYDQITGQDKGLDDAMQARGHTRGCNPYPTDDRWNFEDTAQAARRLPRLSRLFPLTDRTERNRRNRGRLRAHAHRTRPDRSGVLRQFSLEIKPS